MEKTDFLKERSISSCLKSAFDLYCSNFATIFRKTWIPALVVSIVLSLQAFLPQQETIVPTTADLLLSLATAAATAVVFVFLAPWFWSKLIGLFCEMTPKQIYWKNVRLNGATTVMCVAFLVVVLAASFALGAGLAAANIGKATAMGVATIGTVCLTIVFLFAVVPLLYSLTKYVVDPQRTLRQAFTTDYRTGARRYGFLLGTSLILTIIVLIIVCVMSVPMIVLLMANHANAEGMMLGDASALPGSFSTLYFVAQTAMCFVAQYSAVWFFLTALYACGTVDTRLNTRQATSDNGQEAKL